MKVVILAGGRGTRISEESHLKPKPMIEIGDRPILWHILKIYSHFGYNDFLICAGYKQDVIKQFFSDYYLHTSDVTFDFVDNSVQIHDTHTEPWTVTVIDTGLNTMTGGRIKRIQKFVGNDAFMMTYGDAVSDIDVCRLVEFHRSHGKMATVTAVRPGGRFGTLDLDGAQGIRRFAEKPPEDGGWINGGFMVLQPEIFDLIEGDATMFEREPLERAAELGELKAYCHSGFWQCMDTVREKEQLDELIHSNRAPWMLW